MKFCKKCHKIIITNVYTLEDFENRCRCDGIYLVVGSGMAGLVTAVMSNKKRSGVKRKVAKEVNSA